jgi:sugar lactone lactonase YvrE
MKTSTSLALLLQLGCVVGLSACDDDPVSMTADGGIADAMASDCPSVGMGTLMVTVTGLPAGVLAAGTATGPDAVARPLTATGAVAVPAGRYTLAAARVVAPDPIVRSVYDGVAAPVSVCVPSAGSVAAGLSYTMVATSNKVWLGNGNSSAGVTMLGFASAVAGISGAPAATIAADTNGSGGFTFDRNGNMWVVGGTVSDAPLARYPAGSFATGGAKTPDITIGTAAFSAGVPGPKAMAFDQTGNLWVTTGAAAKIVKLSAAQLSASATVVPTVELSALPGLDSIAFDAAGNLWIGYAEGVGYIAAASLSASRAGVDYTIKAESGPPVISGYGTPSGLAFDAAGNLWGAFGTSLVKLTAADRAIVAGTKEKTVTPSVVLGGSVLGLPEGIAFDEGGGLWVAGGVGKFLRFGPMKLAASGQAVPDVVISSPSANYAGSFALYPAPAALPMYHRLP